MDEEKEGRWKQEDDTKRDTDKQRQVEGGREITYIKTEIALECEYGVR